MTPAARISLPGGARLPSINIAPARFRVQGWDPILIISQIVSLQALHYLALTLLTPILVRALASPAPLSLEGGVNSISLIMDWRAFSGQPTVSLPALGRDPLGERLVSLTLADPSERHWRGAMIAALRKAGAKGMGLGVGRDELSVGLMRVVAGDSPRGWAVAFAWIAASLVDVVWLYHLVRRPTHILDFSLTLLFNHTLLTTYYAGSFPTHLFYWLTLAVAVIAQIVLAEQWCVRREMREGFTLDGGGPPSRAQSPVMGRRTPAVGGQTPQVGHARTQSQSQGKGHARGASTSSRGGSMGGMSDLMEMNPLGSSTKSQGRYERVPEEEEEEDRRSNKSA